MTELQICKFHQPTNPLLGNSQSFAEIVNFLENPTYNKGNNFHLSKPNTLFVFDSRSWQLLLGRYKLKMNNSNNNYYRDWPIRWRGRKGWRLHWSAQAVVPIVNARLHLVGGFILADAQRVCDEKGQQDGNNYCEWTWWFGDERKTRDDHPQPPLILFLICPRLFYISIDYCRRQSRAQAGFDQQQSAAQGSGDCPSAVCDDVALERAAKIFGDERTDGQTEFVIIN